MSAIEITERDVVMGIMDKFKNFIGIPEDEYYDDDDVEFIGNESSRAEAFK